MSAHSGARQHRWAIILAGGEGKRLRTLSEQWNGFARPKQFCKFTGTRTMLEHTLDRTAQLVDPERILTVIGKGHAGFVSHLSNGSRRCRFLEQPVSRGTGAAVFWAASRILSSDRQATVLIFPSDHFVLPEDGFLQWVERSAELAERMPERLVLLGAEPDQAETDYGWIEPAGEFLIPGSDGRFPAREVAAFHEKPQQHQASQWLGQGYYWNTMMLSVRVRTLWRLGRELVGEPILRFERLAELHKRFARSRNREEVEKNMTEALYLQIPSFSFSRTILTGAASDSMVVPMQDVVWRDWGRPERVLETLQQLGQNCRLHGANLICT